MRHSLPVILISVVAGVAAARASTLDTIGVTLLRATTTNLNASGVRVGQPEAADPVWEINPTNILVQQSPAIFTYIAAGGSTNIFPNLLGQESGHADAVASNFFGMPGGVATNVLHVDNVEADFFYTNYIAPLLNITDSVINQSFIFQNTTVAEQQQLDSQWDDYAAKYGALFVSGIGNSGAVNPPSTCYNGIGVGAYGGGSSIGPTLDNGRCKPDLVAPADETSYSTPFVSGAAAVLMQAALRGDGGNDTNSAADIRVVKVLLLNGAIKPTDWTNSTSSPLDMRYGAGVLNAFNSYKQLVGGKHTNFVAATVSAGTTHPPIVVTNSISALSGWDFETITSALHPSSLDGVNHYLFNITNSTSNAAFTATATLVWNRQQNQTAINNLNLFLYNAANSNLVAWSTSLVDNVEHIFMPKLPQGRYDLQVWKAGGTTVSTSETYALAWEFFSQSANIIKSGTNVTLNWPVYPDGFLVESTTNLLSPQVWSTNNISPPVFTNNQNIISVNATNAVQFFRLRRP